MRRALLSVVLAVTTSAAVRANDKWEFGVFGGDDTSSTPNALVHGRTQTHDLEGTGSPPDQDWIRVATRARQSYELRIFSATVHVVTPGSPPCGAGSCADFERVNAAGTVLQGPSALEGDDRVVGMRWTSGVTGFTFARVRGGAGMAWSASDEYTIELTNTTLFAPRFNNSGTQVTVLVLQNTTTEPVAGGIDFWGAGGTLLHAEAFEMAPRGVLTLNTSALSAAYGQSGALSISHDAGYGGLTGKAVVLEPATGFTFDTAVAPLPR
jgi:hypothetical protein